HPERVPRRPARPGRRRGPHRLRARSGHRSGQLQRLRGRRRGREQRGGCRSAGWGADGGRPRVRLTAAVLGAALLLTGCGAEYYPDPLSASGPPTPALPAIDTSEPDPTAIYLPKLGPASSLIPLGLTDKTKDGPEGNCLEGPPVFEPEQAGWYAGKKPHEDGDEWKPGETGPAVIVGHVDGLFPDGKKG